MTTAVMAAFGADQQAQRENPLLAESKLAFGALDFSKIQTTDYLPAFEAAINEQRNNIKKIASRTDSATFKNTILPLEDSGKLLTRVSSAFFALVEADKTPELGEIE